MPYYAWQGITLSGNIKKGVTFACSYQELETLLLAQSIGLMTARIKRFVMPIKKSSIYFCIENLASLVKSGIRINQALEIIKNTIKHGRLCSIIAYLKISVEQGKSFADLLCAFPDLFDLFFISLVRAGDESGSLSKALSCYCEYAQTQESFNRKIKSALIGPIVTFLFFIMIAIALFTIVVPQFESVFAGFKEPLPHITYYVLLLSKFITSSFSLYMIVVVLFLIFLMLLFFKTKTGKTLKDYFFLNALGVKAVTKLIYHALIFKMLNILLSGGVPLTKSLKVISKTINNSAISFDLNLISKAIESGKTLSSALRESRYFNKHELYALISIGEVSGDIVSISEHLAKTYDERIHKKLRVFSTLIQPILLIILGILISGLIFALYVPLFTLSAIIE